MCPAERPSDGVATAGKPQQRTQPRNGCTIGGRIWHLFGTHVARRFLDQMHPRAEPELRVDVGEVGLHGAG